MLKFLITLVAITGCATMSTALAGDIATPDSHYHLRVDTSRMVDISEGITDWNIPKFTSAIGKLAQSPGPIYIRLNTGGGDVRGIKIASLIKQLQSSGRTVHCFVTERALSMGFFILNACQNRWVLEDSLLLWHSAATRTGGKSSDFQRVARSLAIVSAHLRRQVLEATKMPPKFYDQHDKSDTKWPAAELYYTGHIVKGYFKFAKYYNYYNGRKK